MNLARAVRLTKPRLAIFAAALAVASAAALTSQAASARTDSSRVFSWAGGTRPIIVLEHGAWADASSWSKVIGLLQQDGFTVYAPPNPLRGVSNDTTYLTDFLTQNAALAGRPVVLVGHSYGGFVITNAATGNSTVKALVYVDAFIPAAGDTLGSLTGTGSCLGSNAFNAVPYPNAQNNDVDLYINQSVVPGCFASGLPPSQAAVIATTQRPLAASTFGQQLTGPPAWKTIPSWAVIGTADKVLPPAQQRSMAKRASSHITDINARHLSMIADPEAVARVIEQAAQATS